MAEAIKTQVELDVEKVVSLLRDNVGHSDQRLIYAMERSIGNTLGIASILMPPDVFTTVTRALNVLPPVTRQRIIDHAYAIADDIRETL